MRTVETTATVDDDRTLNIRAKAPADVPVGEHRALVVIEDGAAGNGGPDPTARWPVHDAGLTEPGLSLRRGDLYGDDGR